ncbi:NUDIX hydrolase, partial [Candidatus Saccharibacteria bacterium]|nr:NUDIX hydrolase [Candidatus Saccharibacteria bacterium]
YGESFEDTVKRVAKKELNIEVHACKNIGYIEYPEHVKSGYGDPRGLAFLVTDFSGKPTPDEEADEVQWFKTVPDKIHPHQDDFLVEHQLLARE